MEAICGVGKYEYGSKEVDKHCIHDGVAIQALLDVHVACTEQSKELHDELFELKIVEYWRVLRLIKNECEIRIIDNLLDFIYVLLVVAIVNFEAEFEVLIVEDPNVGLYVILKDLYDSWRLKQIMIKEGRQVGSIDEQGLTILHSKIL